MIDPAAFGDHFSVGGFNFGTNNGAIARQRIAHVYFHLIPRRPGEDEPTYSSTMRTAHSRTSGENRFDFFMAPFSQMLGPPQNPG
ncbi:HIT domain-containing protein [Ferrovum sp.]|uniref:HIT domain-containing protein n=1 Tax=Ferrovum sp. TaxID=2609467 RepID=UPI00345B6558